MSPLRISLITETFPPDVNGVARTLNRFLHGLKSRGHQVSLLCPHSQLPREPLDEDIPTRQVTGIPIPMYRELRLGLASTSAVRDWWKSHPADVVYIATEGPLGMTARRAALKNGVPFVTGYHTHFDAYSGFYGFSLLQPMIQGHQRRFHNAANCTVVPTNALADQLMQERGYNKVATVSRGVETELFDPARRSQALRQSWGLGDDELALLYVGRLAAEKNIQRVIDCYQKVAANNDKIKLVLVGDGPMRAKLEQQVPEAVFCGTRTGEDLAQHYASGDVFLFASETETFGNVITEAMASGLAVVTYDYAAGRSHIRHGENGFLAPLGDAEAFCHVAQEAVAAADALQPVRKAARETALELHWDRIVERLEAVLLEAANQPKR